MQSDGLRIQLPDGEYHVCRVELASGRVLTVVFPAALTQQEAAEVYENLRTLSGLAQNWAKP